MTADFSKLFELHGAGEQADKAFIRNYEELAPQWQAATVRYFAIKGRGKLRGLAVDLAGRLAERYPQGWKWAKRTGVLTVLGGLVEGRHNIDTIRQFLAGILGG